MKNFFLINEDFENTRLDRWFKKNVHDAPQSLIEKNIRKGNIKVNNKKCKSSYKLINKDKICIKNIIFVPNKTKKSQTSYLPTKSDISSSSSIFIENNENFVVINKPSGIAVQAGTKSRKNILDILKETNEFKDSLPFSVHRIDKETTGILIVAKNRKYAQLFTSLFRLRKIHKTYLAVVIGELQNIKGTLINELFYYEGNEKIKSKAITHFKLIDSNNNYSLLRLNPETGRKHQLRKQLLINGYPILGDTKYRINKNPYTRKNNLMLHAYKINFSIAGVKYNFTAEPPSNFMNFLNKKYLKIF